MTKLIVMLEVKEGDPVRMDPMEAAEAITASAWENGWGIEVVSAEWKV